MEKETQEPPGSREETKSIGGTTNNARASIEDAETQRENARNSNPNGFVSTNQGIDIKAAEAEFADLRRELSGISTKSKALSKLRSKTKTSDEKDVEKTAESLSETETEPFDLEDTLRGNRQAEEDSGIRSKHIGVIWDGLTVRGTGGKKGREVNILKDFRGVMKPGEMVLVLGRPGSGCTTFLKVIANQRFGYTGVDGEVLYGPFDAHEFSKKYRGEAVYNQEDDVHHPTLTRPHGMSKADFKEKVIDTLLRMFNISHTRNTIVGNAFVRGVSGGERKRVSIAEMMVTSGTVCAWDNSTRGLDASTALDYAKSLRIMTNIYKTTTFVSLYQASENIYKQFDKVLVIDDGREVFFGPTTEARAYFEGLGFKEKPRQTTPDFLTGCTDEFEREYAPGRSAADSPHSPETLAQAFLESKFSTRLSEEMEAYRKQVATDKQIHDDFEVAMLDSKRKGASKSSVYSVPYYLQIWALMQRQYLIKWQDKFSLVVSWITSITVAIVLGTVWLDLPQTSAGAFTRGGLLFISLLFNAFQAFSELASTMMGRPIVNKHRSYTFHRPSALWIAQIIVDTAFSAAQILLFSIIVYFMCGLVRDAGAFFTFYLIILSGYLAMTLFFRTVGCLCPDFDYAIKFAATIITFFVITSGYLIQYQSEKVWIRWIYWINALGLGFSALMENEFSRLNLTCTGAYLVPSGPVVLIAAFLFTNATLGEWVSFGAGGNTAKVYQKPNKEREELNQALAAKRDQRRATKSDEEGSEININSKAILTWEGLNYDVPTPNGELRLLNNIFGYVQPGELTALMGASGAGKTTLLDVLASRKKYWGTSYAEQLDVHEGTATVREALRFSADLRQPYDVPQAEKYAYVEEIISLLEMEDMADAIIGDPENGLAVEQRKRVTIGVELAAKPELLLFLDEPTSGLDSQSAFNIVRFLKKLANAGQAILCTIHQPNAALFENFDRLLLLQRGGRCVYFGDIGKDAHVLLDYFHKHGADCPPDANPAEWMLDAIGAGQAPRIGDRDWADIFADSPELANIKRPHFPNEDKASRRGWKQYPR
ncbi:hypothetical protein DID88_003928 [Monilinia fructigena]|uniref:ABC transporter domain-containing protein n=1 Tax=Monilinia fructigena TaxID=38457 RepID=A0A395IV15_9HELO|nr:hypothetical protein DID88_003928 [Monilinia fructigena]